MLLQSVVVRCFSRVSVSSSPRFPWRTRLAQDKPTIPLVTQPLKTAIARSMCYFVSEEELARTSLSRHRAFLAFICPRFPAMPLGLLRLRAFPLPVTNDRPQLRQGTLYSALVAL